MGKSEHKRDGFWSQFINALVLDLAWIVNALLRKSEFRANRVFVRAETSRLDEPEPEPEYRGVTSIRPLLIITALFAVYGPTLDAICSVTGPNWTGYLLRLAGLLALGSGLIGAHKLNIAVGELVDARIARRDGLKSQKIRRGAFRIIAKLASVALPLIPAAGVFYAAQITPEDPDFCYLATPSWSAAFQLLVALAAIGFVLVYLNPKRAAQSSGVLPLVLFSIIGVLSVLIVWASEKGLAAAEADYLPYLHLYPVLLFFLFAVSLASKRVVRKVFRSLGEKQRPLFHEQLERTELFVGRTKMNRVSVPRLAYGMVSPFIRPLHLLLVPALAALVSPPDWLILATVIALVISYTVLVWGGISNHWDTILLMVQRRFLQGLPLVVTLVVILLGVLRVFELHYVAILLDAAPWGAVTMFIVMSYSALWLYDFYINRPLQLKLMELLGAAPTDECRRERIRFDLDPDFDCIRRMDVCPRNRDLQTHGGSWFAVTGVREPLQPEPNAERDIAFRVWSMMDLFQRLGDRGWCNPIDPGEEKKTDPPEISNQVSALRRRVGLYRLSMNAAAVLVLAGFLFAVSLLRGFEKAPLVSADHYINETHSGHHVNLAARLAQQAEQGRPAILLASSGGGTRAALYAYSVLLGLQDQGLLDDLVLASGVSGGGVALAYFAAHRDGLVQGKGVCGSDGDLRAPWVAFRETMGSPFIIDVLEGILELRIYWKTNWSHLLQESFARRFYPENEPPVKGRQLGSPRDLGLIFNTSITGHPYDDSQLTRNLFAAQPDVAREEFYANMNGGRLIFTNLSDTSAFDLVSDPPDDLLGQDLYLPYQVVQDGSVPLIGAATLTANFPPVFADALVCLQTSPNAEKGHCDKRYQVTDGGATDNRGLLSLLQALEHALSLMKQEQVPDIHILIAEASSFSYDYSGNTRGLGTAFSGSKERLGNGLLHELYANAKRSIPDTSVLRSHYLAMPSLLRSRGGLGTHWMMPGSFEVNDPYDPAPRKIFSRPRKISKEQFYSLLDTLYTDRCRPGGEPSPGATQWLCISGSGPSCSSASGYAETWRELKQKMQTYPPRQGEPRTGEAGKS